MRGMPSLSELLNALRPFIADQIQQFVCGTSNPASPPGRGIPFFRSDQLELMSWDDTNGLWVGQPFYLGFTVNDTSTGIPLTASGIPFAAVLLSYVVYHLRTWSLRYVVTGVNNAANYWQVKLYVLSSAGASTLLASMDTSGTAAGVGARYETASFALNPIDASGYHAIYLQGVKVGAPGPLYLAPLVRCREVLS